MQILQSYKNLEPRTNASQSVRAFTAQLGLLYCKQHFRFPDADQSLKRPDITIFCSQPPAVDEALELLPEAVIEVISVGYEEKDTGPDGAPFYITNGVRDVLVIDPRSGHVQHYQPDAVIKYYQTHTHSILPVAAGCICQIKK